MTGNVGGNLLSDVVLFSKLSPENPIDFHDETLDVFSI